MNETFLFRFTPSLMESQALESILVQREAAVQRVVELIRESALKKSKHHTLLIGPRGIGKTHFVSITYHRIKAMEDLGDRLAIAWLREDEWGITSFLDLLIRIFRALAEEYKNSKIDERVEGLYKLPPNEMESAACALLKKYVGKRTLLVIIENLDDIFRGLGDEGQKRLRAYIQENPFFTILATAQSLFNGVSLRTSPFYGFFRIQHLESLSFEDAVQLLTKLAKYKGDEDLAAFIQTPMGRARIRAVSHLAGGNHRVYVIFSQFLTRESLDELVSPFMRMLDDLTPYYQERMRWLSPQQRKIVEFLSNRRDAVIVKEIAQRCFMTHQTASSQLRSLKEMEYVQSIQIGRESYYELREPLMRLCVEVKKNRGEPIRLLIDFLRLWYLPSELQQKLAALQPDANLEREYLIHTLKLIEQEPGDLRLAACLKDFITYWKARDFAQTLKVAEELVVIRGEAGDWLAQGVCLNYLARYEEALVAFNKAIELEPNNASIWGGRGVALGNLGPTREALVSFNKAIELEPNDGWYWKNKGAALGNIGKYEEALSSNDKAIALGERSSGVFFNRAEMMLALNHWNEGIAELDSALQRFARSEKIIELDTEAIIRNLINSTRDAEILRNRIKSLIDIYEKHEVVFHLGPALVQNIKEIAKPTFGREAAQIWRDLWMELASDLLEIRLPLRLLDIAIRYLETKDERTLLEISTEERKLLESFITTNEQATS